MGRGVWYNVGKGRRWKLMARHKVIKPEDRKYKLAKKKDRIRKTVDGIYVILLLSSILICGLNQFNHVFVGWGLLFMGILSIPNAIFHIHLYKKGHRYMRWYNAPENRKYISKETLEEYSSATNFMTVFEMVFLILFSIGFPILGIIKLFDII